MHHTATPQLRYRFKRLAGPRSFRAIVLFRFMIFCFFLSYMTVYPTAPCPFFDKQRRHQRIVGYQASIWGWKRSSVRRPLRRSKLSKSRLHIFVNSSCSIVAVHGLNGHPENTWTAENGTIWIRDLIKHFIPNCRVLSYGYPAYTHATKERQLQKETLDGHGHQLMASLVLLRQDTGSVTRT